MRSAASAGGNRGAVVNAADEVAVAAFLDGGIGFPSIGSTIREAVDRWGSDEEPDLATIVALDAEIRTTLDAELR